MKNIFVENKRMMVIETLTIFAASWVLLINTDDWHWWLMIGFILIVVTVLVRNYWRIINQDKKLRRFEAAAEQAIEMMVFTDPEGVVLWANEAMEKITGFARSEAVGLKAGILWGKLMNKEWYATMWKTIKIEKKTFRAEIENHRKNGEHFYSTITIYPLLDDRGKVEFFVATQRDITQEKAVDRMKTEFISLASHQLRTPLTAMRWNLELLKTEKEGKLDLRQKELIKRIYQSNLGMIELVGQLLDISHLESGKIKVKIREYTLEKLLTKPLAEFEPLRQSKKQKISIKGKVKLRVLTDYDLFVQILQNLLSNASKYSNPDGTIWVTFTQDNDMARIEVSDRGMGIAKAEYYRIFDKYYRSEKAIKMSAEGTGLGLYLARIIAKRLGGEMGFESEEGKGSNFWFTVPLKSAKAKVG